MKLFGVMLVFCTLPTAILSESLPSFVQSEFQKHQQAIQRRFSPSCDKICKELGIDKNDSGATNAINSLLFLHSLFTADDATDCSRGGILKTVYLWHWVDTNPRHFLLHLPDSVKLIAMKPPRGFEKYKSFADIDRLPSIYLADAVASKPAYFHPLCGEIYTFGWCSEREMAFNALLSLLGYDCKVKQEGIHVWTEVLLKPAASDATRTLPVLSFDNTFNKVGFRKLRETYQAWKGDIGSGAQVKWYNSVAHSTVQLNAVKVIEVKEPAKQRIEKDIQLWLGK